VPRERSLPRKLDAWGAIGIDWSESPFDVEQFRMGLEVELEHGQRDWLGNLSLQGRGRILGSAQSGLPVQPDTWVL